MPPTVQTTSREDRERRGRGTGERKYVMSTFSHIEKRSTVSFWAIIQSSRRRCQSQFLKWMPLLALVPLLALASQMAESNY